MRQLMQGWEESLTAWTAHWQLLGDGEIGEERLRCRGRQSRQSRYGRRMRARGRCVWGDCRLCKESIVLQALHVE
jgi:hypothetical protein